MPSTDECWNDNTAEGFFSTLCEIGLSCLAKLQRAHLQAAEASSMPDNKLQIGENVFLHNRFSRIKHGGMTGCGPTPYRVCEQR